MKLARNLSVLIGTVAAGVLMSAAPAKAFTYTVSSSSFNVTTSTGQSYHIGIIDNAVFNNSDVSSLLTGQSWWGDGTTAALIRDAVITSTAWETDSHNTGNITTFAAYNGPTYNSVLKKYFVGVQDTNGGGGTVRTDLAYSYMTATAVPFSVPGGATVPVIGTLVALGLIRKAKRCSTSKMLIENI